MTDWTGVGKPCMLMIGLILCRVSQCGCPLHPSFSQQVLPVLLLFSDCSWLCWLLVILPNDQDLTLRSPLHTVDSPACFLRDTTKDVMTFIYTNILCHHELFASLCPVVSLSVPSSLWIRQVLLKLSGILGRKVSLLTRGFSKDELQNEIRNPLPFAKAVCSVVSDRRRGRCHTASSPVLLEPTWPVSSWCWNQVN